MNVKAVIIKGAEPKLRLSVEGLTYEKLSLVNYVKPEALLLKDEDGNTTFRVTTTRNEAVASVYGVEVSLPDESEKGEEISVTFDLNQPKEIRNFVAVQIKNNFEAVIKQVEAFLTEIEAAEGEIEHV